MKERETGLGQWAGSRAHSLNKRVAPRFPDHRFCAPASGGFTKQGREAVRAVQLRRPNSRSNSGGFGFGKLWRIAEMQNVRIRGVTVVPDDPDYNPNDSAMARIHCRV